LVSRTSSLPRPACSLDHVLAIKTRKQRERPTRPNEPLISSIPDDVCAIGTVGEGSMMKGAAVLYTGSGPGSTSASTSSRRADTRIVGYGGIRATPGGRTLEMLDRFSIFHCCGTTLIRLVCHSLQTIEEHCCYRTDLSQASWFMDEMRLPARGGRPGRTSALA